MGNIHRSEGKMLVPSKEAKGARVDSESLDEDCELAIS